MLNTKTEDRWVKKTIVQWMFPMWATIVNKIARSIFKKNIFEIDIKTYKKQNIKNEFNKNIKAIKEMSRKTKK